MLVLSKGFAHKAFEPIADDSIAVRFADRNAQPGIFKIILCHVEHQYIIAPTPAVNQYGLELAVADKPFLFWEGKTLHYPYSHEGTKLRKIYVVIL